ncbi:hypothetical protein KY325_02110, partial [Candidatus Woesearchaeota archaeon]|nr:hypothetical protein [Candidatus Woesearchaeota archaeon]
RVIEEFIGFFGEIIRPKVYTMNIKRSGPGTPTTTEVKKHTVQTNIRHIGHALKQEMYHSQICPELSFDEYKAVVDNVEKILEGLQQYFSMQEIDRILYHCQTIDQLKRVYLVVSIQQKI